MSQSILIVEDHAGVRQSLREWLELSFPDYELLEAASGEEAVATAQAKSPSLIIMDIGLPGMTGIEATETIKKTMPNTKVIMLTIFDDEDYRSHAAEAGAFAYVPKRKIKTELMPVVRRILQGDKGGA